jgi:threonine/homoserine/homoserine lactone efflux protein
VTELLAGLSLGLGAGLVPGPLLALVVTSSLQQGFGAGVRVAIAPLLTDLPIVTLAVWLVASLSPAMVRWVGVLGGVVVVGVGIQMVWRSPVVDDAAPPSGGDLVRAMIVNLANPHPWIFWVVAGAPLLVSAWHRAPGLAVAFLAGFYLLLVGTKVVVAAVAAHTASHLSQTWRARTVYVGAALLVIGGAVLIWEGAAGRL